MGFWDNFAQGLERSPGLTGLAGIGLSAFLNNRNKVPGTPAGGAGIPDTAIGPTPRAPIAAPPPAPPAWGPPPSSGGPPLTGMAQPTMFAPGAKSQMDATSIPQGPGFKFPSAMRAGMYSDGNGGYAQ